MPPPQETLNNMATYLSENGLELIVAAVIFVVSIRLIGYFVKLLDSVLQRKKVDPKLTTPIVLGVKYLSYLVLFGVIGSFLGLNTTTLFLIVIVFILFIAIAMQSTLANIGGGVMLLVIKPFKKGDYVNINNQEGFVREISLYHTQLIIRDNSVVFIPNAEVLNTDIVNMDARQNRRVSIDIFVSSDSDTDKLIQAAKAAIKGDSRILTSHAPRFFVKQIYPYGIKMRTNLWAKKAEYWDVLYDYNAKILEAYKSQGVRFPNMPVAYTPETTQTTNAYKKK